MFEALQDFTASLPEFLQWFGVFLISAIPFVESYFGSAIGVIAGINPFIAVAAAVAGNVLSMLVFVLSTHSVRTKVRSHAVAGTDASAPAPQAKPLSPRREKLRKKFDQWGVPGVSLIGQLVLPSQITSAAMVSFGASKNAVILWQIISIVLWGAVFGTLATIGVVAIG